MKTIFKLAEANDEWSDDDQDNGPDREEKIIALLTDAAHKMGLDLAEINHPVLYDDASREASICVFESVSLEQLQALTSLGSMIKVAACASHRDVAQISFVVNSGMENANLSETKSALVPASALSHLNRWDAPHVIAVADEVKSRGGELDDPAAMKSASDDVKFVDDALPVPKPVAAIRNKKKK